MVKRLFALAIALLLVIGLAACNGTTQTPTSEKPVEENTNDRSIEVSLPAGFSASFNPLTTDNKYNFDLSNLLYDSLFYDDSKFQPHNRLVANYSTTGDIYTLTLQSDVTFHDGSKLTSKDVVYTLNTVKQNKSNHYYSRLAHMQNVRAIDDSQVEITLNQVDYTFPAQLEIPIVKDGTGTKDEPTGSGAYRLNRKGSSATLSVNTSWPFASDFSVEKITLVDIKDNDALVEAMDNGALSAVSISAADYGKLLLQGNYDYFQVVTNDLVYLGVNYRGVLASAPLRKAMSASIDRSRILEDVLQKGGYITTTPLCPTWYLFDATGLQTEEVGALFAGAGYTKDGEGRLMKGGKQLTLSLVAPKDNFTKSTVARMAAEGLQNAGVNVNVQYLADAAYTSAVKNGSFDLYMGEVKLTPDMDLSPLVGSGGTLNYGRVASVSLQKALEAMRQAVPLDQAATGASLTAAVEQETPLIPLFFNTYSLVTKKGDITLSPTPYNPYFGIWQGIAPQK